jgi:hypothetical protein
VTARIAAAAIAASVVAAGLRWGTFAAGGPDSYCYLHQAERWASGTLQEPYPLALGAPWPSASMTFAPAGHIPSTKVAGASVPMCPPGLSIAMAPFRRLGGRTAMFLVVPLLGAVLVWSTFLVGRRFNDRVGVCAALLTACSPIVLFQLMQPMSDVPAAAWWVLAVAFVLGLRRRDVVLAGLASAAAIVTRPNLLPIGFVIGLFVLLRPERRWRATLLDGAAYAAAVAPGCAAVALIQQLFYGSPFSSGYGDVGTLFAIEHVHPNTFRYAQWLLDSHTPAVALAFVAPFGSVTVLALAIAAVNLACYLPYSVFDDWWYLRFLLPSVPMVMVLMVAGIDRLADRFAGRLRATVVLVATAALAAVFLVNARNSDVFRLERLEAKFVKAGEYVARRLPPNALVITSFHSGSVRHYSGRPTLSWAELDAAWLERSLDFARAEGYEPYLLFESWEEQRFRDRFAGNPVGALDWPPMAEIAGLVRIYAPGHRARYLAGGAIQTEYVR